MTISQLQVQEFMGYFSGSLHSYGELTYGPAGPGKRTGQYRTVKDRLLTPEEYRAHLEGKKGLGVVPVNEKERCRFVVLDVDVYGTDLSAYIKAAEANGFPLVPFRSKSGGLHFYMFLREESPIQPAVALVRRMSFLLSIDALVKREKNSLVEVFPKQAKIAKGGTGSWINLPYYNAEDTQSFCVREGRQLGLNDALLYIRERQTTLAEAEEFLANLPYNDAPPCLQLISILGQLGENSGRNHYLFSFGVYLKKKNEDYFEQGLREVNESLPEPLGQAEVERTVVASLKKKDYLYKCKEAPCVDFCNRRECREREFGIGKNEGYFSSVECGVLFQYKTNQPYYEWEVRLQGQDEWKRLRFKSEDEIIRQDAFLRLCMRELYELPSKLKSAEWHGRVNQALREIQVVQVGLEDDTSPIVMLRELIRTFLMGRALAETKDQIKAGRAYFCRERDEFWFRAKDLTDYVFMQRQFRHFTPSDLHAVLKEMNATPRSVWTESKKQVRVVALGQKALGETLDESTVLVNFDEYTDKEF